MTDNSTRYDLIAVIAAVMAVLVLGAIAYVVIS